MGNCRIIISLLICRISCFVKIVYCRNTHFTENRTIQGLCIIRKDILIDCFQFLQCCCRISGRIGGICFQKLFVAAHLIRCITGCLRSLFCLLLQGFILLLQAVQRCGLGIHLITVLCHCLIQFSALLTLQSRHDEKSHHRHANHQSVHHIQNRMESRIVLHPYRLDDRLIISCISNIIFILLFFLRLILIGLLVQLFQIPECLCIITVHCQYFLNLVAGTRIIFHFHIEKSQKKMCVQKFAIDRQHLFQLNNGQIITSLLAIYQRLIVFSQTGIYCIQPRRIILNGLYIFICNILAALETAADDPLGQGFHSHSHLIINQSQKVSCIGILFINLQTFAQCQYCSRQVAYLCLLQTFVIVCIGKLQHPAVQLYIGTALAAVLGILKVRSTVKTFHIFTFSIDDP